MGELNGLLENLEKVDKKDIYSGMSASVVPAVMDC